MNAVARTKADADKLLREAYDNYYEAVYKYCLVRTRYAKGSEEDSLQNAFLIYYKRLLAGESFVNVKAFLYRTCENLCRQADTLFLRSAKRSVDLFLAEEIPAGETDRPASELDYEAIQEKLLKLLNAQEQELFRFKYVERKSLKEISKILGISPNAAALRTSRLRKKIKTLVSITMEEVREGGGT